MEVMIVVDDMRAIVAGFCVRIEQLLLRDARS